MDPLAASPAALAALLPPPPSTLHCNSHHRNHHTHTMSSNESISNKVGNATGGTVGDETLTHQATHLASSTLDYAKGLVGLGQDAGAKSGEDAANNAHGANSQHTLGELVGEARDLAANVLHTASECVQLSPVCTMPSCTS